MSSHFSELLDSEGAASPGARPQRGTSEDAASGDAGALELDLF